MALGTAASNLTSAREVLQRVVNHKPGPTPCFSDVWQAKDLLEPDFGCVARKGVTDAFCGSVAGKGLRGQLGTLCGGLILREGMAENTISGTIRQSLYSKGS